MQKKLLSDINEKFPQYQNRTKLAQSIKKLEYAIKATLKKIQTIQGYIQLYEEVSRTMKSPKKRKLDEDTVPEETLQMAATNPNNSEPHSLSTPVSTKTLVTSQEIKSGQVNETESTP